MAVNSNAPGFFSGRVPGNPVSNTDKYVVSGQLVNEEIILTLTDNSRVRFSVADIYNHNELDGASFDNATRTLTINQDGREFTAYIPSGVPDGPDTDTFVVSGVVQDDTLRMTYNNGESFSIDLSPFERHTHRDITGVIEIDNNDVASFDSANAVDNESIEVASDGKLRVKDGGIDTDMLVSDTITINGIPGTLGKSITIPTGDNPVHPDNSQFNFTLSDTESELGDTDKTVTITLTLETGYTIQSATVQVSGVDNSSITVTTVSELSSYTFPLKSDTAGQYTVQVDATVFRSSDSETFQDYVVKHIPIGRGWYSVRATNPPRTPSEMTNEGVWRGSAEEAVTGTNTLYFALPVGSDYEFLDGSVYISTTEGSFDDNNYRLYIMDDNVLGTTKVNIQED